MEEKFSDYSKLERLNTIINRIQKVYFVFACIAALGTFYKLLNSNNSLESGPIGGLLAVVLFSFLYFGLKKRKQWAIPLTLIVSAGFMFSSFLFALEAAKDIGFLVSKGFDFIFFLFSAYQLAFFSKKEVKAIFQHSGTLIY